MATRQDILLDDSFDPICEDGDFAPGDSDAQNVQLLESVTKGEFKEFPTVGAGLIHWLKKQQSTFRDIKREITVQLENDGYKASNFQVDENGEYIHDYEPNY